MAITAPITYRVPSGQPINGGRFPGGRSTGNILLSDTTLSGGFSVSAPVWDANLGITALTLPSSITTAGFTLLASGDRNLDFYGSFTQHQGMVYYSPLRAMICFGAETHGNAPYNGVNSPRIIELETMKLSRALPDDPVTTERLSTDGIPWADAAHTRPWSMHAFRQMMVVGSEVWVAYDAMQHSYFDGYGPPNLPIYEGVATTTKPVIWAWNPNTKVWRYIDGGANNANVAAMLGVSYGLVYSASRNSIMGRPGGSVGWAELSLTDYTLGASRPSMPISGVNNYSLLLPDGRVIVGAGGEGDTVLFSIVDPANPAAYTTINKASYSAISGLSTRDTPWAVLPSGRIIGFLKDVAGGLLRPFIFDPADNSLTDSGHSLNIGTTGSSTTWYWQACDYASDYGQVIFASYLGSLLRVWSYKPSSGV
jgi:hypothetical protein